MVQADYSKTCTLLKTQYLLFIITLIINLIPSYTNAQGFTWLSSVSGGNSNDLIYTKSIVTDNLGYSYITGTFFNGATIDTVTLNSVGEEDIFLAKLDKNGKLLWVETVGGLGKDISFDIELDRQGGLYFSGVFTDTAFFDTITVSGTIQNQSNVPLGINFLAKYDTTGTIQWIKKGAQTTTYNFNNGNESKIKYKNGFIYYVGSNILYNGNSISQQTFDSFLLPGIPVGITSSIAVTVSSFVLKTDISGNNQWIRPISANPSNTSYSNNSITDISIRPNNHIVLQCLYSNNIVVDTASFIGSPPVSVYTTSSAVIIELDPSSFFYQASPILSNVGINNIGNVNSTGLGLDGSSNTIFLQSSYTPITIAGTTLTANSTALIKLDTSLMPIAAFEISSNSNYFNALDVKDDKVIIGGTLSGVLHIGSNSYFRSRECVFVNIDTSLTTVNWFTSTKSDYSTSSFILNYSVTDCHFGDDNAAYFTGKTGLVPMEFGDYSSSLNSINNGFTTKIIGCESTISQVTPINPVICGTGSSITLNANYNTDLKLNWYYEGVIQNGSIGNAYVTANTGAYFIEVDSLGCKDTSNTVDVVFSPLPNVSTPPNTITVCSNGGIVPLQGGLPLGGTWSGFGVVNDTLFDPAIVASGPTLLTYSYTNPLGCSDSDVQIANVVPPPSLLVSNSLPTFCEGDAPYLLNPAVFPSGGSYSGVGVNGNIFNPDSSGVGTHLITYNYADGSGCSQNTTFSLIVSATPVINFPSINPICQTNFAIPLNTAQPSGGSYDGPFVISNNFYPFLSGTGAFPITYTATQNGCTVSDTQIIQVDPLAQSILINPGDYCLNNSEETLVTGSPSGGIYQINGSPATSINPATLGIGTYTLEYVYTNSCGFAIDSQNFSVLSLPNTTISNFGPLCENGADVVLNSGTPIGGTYSGIGVTGTNFSPSILGSGIFDTYYSYTDSNGCSSTDSVSTIINTAPNITAALDTLYCTNGAPYNLSASPTGGTWSGSGVTGNTFNPTTAGAGAFNLQYISSNSLGCTDTLEQAIEVKNIPLVSFSTLAPICNSSSNVIPLSGGNPLGGTYTGIGVSNGAFNPALTGSGFFTINYSYTDSFGCTNSTNQNLTVDTTNVTLAQVDFLGVCINIDSILLTGGSPLGGTYSGIAVSNNSFNPTIAGIGTYDITYSYTGINACIATVIKPITINSLPAVSLNPLSDFCLNDSIITLNTGQPTGGSYSGLGVFAGQFNPIIAGTGTSNLIYAYTDTNGCTAIDTSIILVNSLPIVNLAMPNQACVNAATFALNTGFPTGGTYSGLGVSAGQFNPAIAGAGTNNLIYAYTDTNGCTAIDTSITLVNPLPVVNLVIPNQTCVNAATSTLNTGFPTGGTYSGVGVLGTTFDPSINGVGFVPVAYVYTDSNNCVNSAFDTIFINSSPIIAIVGDSMLCQGDSTSLLATGASFYQWNTSDTTASVAISPSTSTIYSVTGIDTNGCSATDSITLSINTLLLTIDTFDANCNGELGAAYANVSGSGINYIYTWSNGATTDSISATAGVFCLTVSDNNGCVTTSCANINEPSPLLVTVVDNGNGSATANVSGGSITTTYNYLWSDGQNSAIASGLSAGLNCVSVTDDNGCIDTACVSLILDRANLNSDDNEIIIYPNPTSSKTFVKINLVNPQVIQLDIVDVTGRTLSTQVVDGFASNLIELSTANFSSGVYLIRCTINNEVITRRLIVQK
jgi:hypothetical protein